MFIQTVHGNCSWFNFDAIFFAMIFSDVSASVVDLQIKFGLVYILIVCLLVFFFVLQCQYVPRSQQVCLGL